MEKKYLLPLAALSVLGFANLDAARNEKDKSGCTTDCTQDDCKPTYCLGPDNYAVNAPVCPTINCDGDFKLFVTPFYWNAHQDGMEYAVLTHVQNPAVSGTTIADGGTNSNILQLNTLTDTQIQRPDFKWQWGFKLGFDYCTSFDGWDVGATWTYYKGKAHNVVEAEASDNRTLLPIWSAFSPAQGSVLYATEIDTDWKLDMNLLDLELAREFWSSKYLALRPHVGLRIAFLDQNYNIDHSGGSWSARTAAPLQDPFNGYTDLTNDYRGVGVRTGLNTTWNIGCGWAFFSDAAGSLVYGRFSNTYKERIRLAVNPHDKYNIAEYDYSFRATRLFLDLNLGLQWSTQYCDGKYGFLAALSWENHLFLDMNQMWRINRAGDLALNNGVPNLLGENVYAQRRGSLDLQGWSLKIQFSF